MRRTRKRTATTTPLSRTLSERCYAKLRSWRRLRTSAGGGLRCRSHAAAAGPCGSEHAHIFQSFHAHTQDTHLPSLRCPGPTHTHLPTCLARDPHLPTHQSRGGGSQAWEGSQVYRAGPFCAASTRLAAACARSRAMETAPTTALERSLANHPPLAPPMGCTKLVALPNYALMRTLFCATRRQFPGPTSTVQKSGLKS